MTYSSRLVLDLGRIICVRLDEDISYTDVVNTLRVRAPLGNRDYTFPLINCSSFPSLPLYLLSLLCISFSNKIQGQSGQAQCGPDIQIL